MTRERAQEMMDDILDHGTGTSTWELDFLDSLENTLDAGDEISRKQAEKLREIHDRRT